MSASLRMSWSRSSSQEKTTPKPRSIALTPRATAKWVLPTPEAVNGYETDVLKSHLNGFQCPCSQPKQLLPIRQNQLDVVLFVETKAVEALRQLIQQLLSLLRAELLQGARRKKVLTQTDSTDIGLNLELSL